MRKTLTLILTVILAVSFIFAFTGCGKPKPDFESPIQAVDAFVGGENVVGKTMSVTATMDYFSMSGVTLIYSYSDLEPRQIMVSPENNTGTDIKQGQTVTVRITAVDTHIPHRYLIEGTVE